MAIHIITGPPCGGKTTHVQTRAKPGDIRIDLDAIANLLANTQGHEHTSDTLKVARAARTAAINKALEVTGVDVWIIHTQPNAADLERYAQHNANIITIDPGKDEVMHRCKTQRPRASLIAAAKWYDQQTQTNAASNHATINHTVLGKQERPNSHLRGYTHYEHKKPRQLLMRKHKDGAECFWCGLPMFKKPERNWDERPLAADHSQPGGAARGMKPDRLLHGYCNSQAGDHSRDDVRPVVVGCHPRDWLKPVSKKKRVEVDKLFKW